ncbi:hypothetical protein [Halobacillus aidingensis]|uniref:Uncharacterized protein n=1 Tax=Halobacillus aidingensis TaxID=240303 RepID=A0A1H0VSW1_HALAD|nr:hypothetical protein [Halobacillus aidingensis]SDP81679.1 hypothetical protein SAMN05421677_1433 [Halobacillus aidingensis]
MWSRGKAGDNLKRLPIANILVFLVLGIFIYLKANPPLSANGISFYQDNETKRVVEIVNSGFADIKLKNVLVNGNKAENVELGASRTNHMVAGGGLDEDRYITFHKINELEVQPELPLEELRGLYEKDDRQIIKHYGLAVIGNEVPEKINIKYTYLYIPYSLEVNVTE